MLIYLLDVLEKRRDIDDFSSEFMYFKCDDDAIVFKKLIKAMLNSNSRYTMYDDFILAESKRCKCKIMIHKKGELIDMVLFDPQTPKINSFDDYRRAIKNLNFQNSSFDLYKKGISIYNDDKVVAVSSLIKIVVAGCVLLEKKTELKRRLKIREGNVSNFSHFYTLNDINKEFTVEELLMTMMIASDNTAFDTLIDFVGRSNINKYINSKGYSLSIRKSKEIYDINWNNEEKPGASILDIKWDEGGDYFVPLELIRLCFKDIYDSGFYQYVNNDKLLFKGGNAPGVLSFAWYYPQEEIFLGLAVNDNEVINIFDLYFINKASEEVLKIIRRKEYVI